MPQRIGIFGGSFNPVHNAHINIARRALTSLSLDFMLFIPLGIPPHKNTAIMAPAKDRTAMLRLAIEGEPRFIIDTLEIDRGGTTYTIDTMRTLHKKYPGASFYYIIGMDTLFELKHWQDYRAVMQLTSFAVLPRENTDESAVKAITAEYERDYGARILFLDCEASDLSSSEIRQQAFLGRRPAGMPDKTAEYIASGGIYSPEILQPWLKERMSDKRYAHSLSVAEEAVSLARRWGADAGRAKLAGLLHDCAKGLGDDEMLALADKYGIAVDEVMAATPNLLHGDIGSMIIRHELAISDAKVLSAVQKHTFAGQQMSKLDKIIFISDMIERGRSFSGVDFLREMAYNNLNEAFMACLGQTISFVINKKQLLHERSVRAWNQMLLSLREEK